MFDPNGEAAFFVTRPTGIGNTQHAFVIVTDGDSINDPVVARYSFGPEKSGGRGALNNRTGTGDNTDTEDAATVARIQGGDTDGTTITQINAADETVIAVGDAAIGNDDYDPVPGALGRPDGANSNSAAVAISRRSAEIDGNTFDPPDGVNLPGANYDDLVELNEERLPQ